MYVVVVIVTVVVIVVVEGSGAVYYSLAHARKIPGQNVIFPLFFSGEPIPSQQTRCAMGNDPE